MTEIAYLSSTVNLKLTSAGGTRKSYSGMVKAARAPWNARPSPWVNLVFFTEIAYLYSTVNLKDYTLQNDYKQASGKLRCAAGVPLAAHARVVNSDPRLTSRVRWISREDT